MTKKILCITPFMVTGGAERVVYHIASGLKEAGHHVTLVSTDGHYARKLKEKAVDFKEISTLPQRSIPGLTRSIWSMSRILKGREYDLINSHSYIMTCISFIALLLIGKRCPIVFTVHLPERKWYLRVMGKTLNWMVDHIITVCADMKSILINQSIRPEKISTIYNGVDPEKFSFVSRSCPDNMDLKIGVIARLVERKGHRVLIDALSMLKEKYPGNNISLHFAGQGPNKMALEGYIAAKGLKDSVSFCGDVRDVPGFLKQVDIFVLPSFYEGFPLSIIEAMAMGLPVIATHVNGIPEIIKNNENGILVMPGDAGEMSRAIETICHDRFFNEISRSNRDLVNRKFSISSMQRAYARRFTGIIDHRRAAR